MDSPSRAGRTGQLAERARPGVGAGYTPVRTIRTEQLLHIKEAQTTLAQSPGRDFHSRGRIDFFRLGVALG